MSTGSFNCCCLFDRYESESRPQWAAAIDCSNWAQFFLKFTGSDPTVTCAIPATSRVNHLGQNMAVGRRQLPDKEMHPEIIRYIESL